MPELPDLENYAENLNALISGKTVCGYRTHCAKCVSGDVSEFLRQTAGRTCVVMRFGKELLFDFDDVKLGLHLMLCGELYFVKTADSASVRNKLFSIDFCGGESLIVTDLTQYARITLFAKPDYTVPDALSQDFSYDYFRLHLLGTRKSVKAMLLDQNFVKGIGNAYADEILWHAGIHPDSLCCSLPDDEADKLFGSIPTTLTQAISEIKAVSPMRIRGEERSFFAVHNPNKTLSPTGYAILSKTVSSKKTYFTAEQKLFK